MEIQNRPSLTGFESAAFMPNDYEILKIGDDVIQNEDSRYKQMVQEIDMYDISFIQKLATAVPSIKAKNQFLVSTFRSPNPNGNGYACTLSGCTGDYWKPNRCAAEIKDSAGLVTGFRRELVLYRGGKGGRGGVNSHWTMREFFYKSIEAKREKVICTVSLETATIKKQSGTLLTGVEAAKADDDDAYAYNDAAAVADDDDDDAGAAAADDDDIEENRKHFPANTKNIFAQFSPESKTQTLKHRNPPSSLNQLTKMEIQNRPSLMGFESAFMPNDYEILKIGDDVLQNDDSRYKQMVQDVDMYDISFIQKLATAVPSIKAKNQFLVSTFRSPNPNGNGYARTLSGCTGDYWKPNRRAAEIKDSAGLVTGFRRELVLYRGGKGGRGGVNSHWIMREFFYKSIEAKREKVICTVSLETATIKKQLGTLLTGVEAAKAGDDDAYAYNDAAAVADDDDDAGAAAAAAADDDDDFVIAVGKMDLGTRRVTRGDIRKPMVKPETQASGTKAQVTFQGEVEGENTPRRVELNFSQERDSTGEYYNKDESDYNQKKMAKHWGWKDQDDPGAVK